MILTEFPKYISALIPGLKVTKPISSVPLFSWFVYGDTSQIWKRFKETRLYFCKVKYFLIGEINEQLFREPHSFEFKTIRFR